MTRDFSALRIQMESALAGRVMAPFTYRDRSIADTVPTGISEIDSSTGGLPRGGLTEICGPRSSGRTSLLVSALASRTANAEVCALIDARDAFDPHSAQTAGVALDQLLWVRCRNIDQALRSADLLLQSGGFGMVALDLGDIARETVRYIPLNVWFRFRRAVEDTPTILVVIEQEPHAKTCASLVLHMDREAARWSAARHGASHEFLPSPHTFLFEGCLIRAGRARSRVQSATLGADGYPIQAADRTALFETVNPKR
jgi:recombination protein RecA